MKSLPAFPGVLLKNDALFMYGALADKPFVYVYEQTAIEVVHGPSCAPEREIDLALCEQESIPVVRRRGGGGTVVLSPGQIVVLAVGVRKPGETPLAVFGRIHNGYIQVLERAGLRNVQKTGISDLAIGERKILGSSLYLGTRPSLYYYQSSLLVDADLSLFTRYLRHPPRTPDYRKARSHEEFCTTLREAGCTLGCEALAGLLRNFLAQSINL